MRILLTFLLLGVLTSACAAEPRGAAETGRYRNLFAEYLGKSDAEIKARVDAA